jgi:rhamnose transport system permease protein
MLGLTPFGRATYAIGANETAARFSGIRVECHKLWIYSASGFLRHWPR